MSLERAAKLGILAWSIAALALDLWLLRGAWRGLPLTMLIAGTGVALVSIFVPRIVAIVMAISYVFPTLVYFHVGHYYSQYADVWLALLLASILPHALRTSWHVPDRWRGALIGWAVVTIAGATIVSVREMDFTPALFNGAAFNIRWVLHVALVTTIGILWFDWLISGNVDFHRWIATPLACGAVCMSAVALYQLFVDVTALNPTVYGVLRRASGTVFDGNVCGTLAAIWIGGAALLARRHAAVARYVVPATTTLGWLAVWATGSRTGFAAAAIVTGFVIAAMTADRRRLSRARAALTMVAIGIAALVLLVLLTRADLGVVGPMARFRSSVPTLTLTAIAPALYEHLWNRNGYGGASTAMIGQFPLFGVGVGMFQTLLPEFASFGGGAPLPPDNAQNWYRHQLAELGLVGSLPWLGWVLMFAGYVMTPRPSGSPGARIARGMIVAFAAISFLGMPGQEPIVAITFWTLAFWFMSVAGIDRPREARRRWSALAISAIVIAYAAGTLYAARTDLRVPARAQRGGWPYSYGFYRPGRADFGPGPGWTGRHAVAVVKPDSEWLWLTVSADYRSIPGAPFAGSPQAPTRPIQVTLRCNGARVVDTQLTTTAPVRMYVRAAVGRSVLLESWVNRVVPLQQLGIDDDRAIGVLVEWASVGAPSSDQDVAACGAAR